MSTQMRFAFALHSDAVFSPDRKYRYALWRIWDERQPICMFIGLNPSKADENRLDPTTVRAVGFARTWGYGGFCMTNMYGLVSSDPRALLVCDDPIGPDNDAWLVYLAAYSGVVVGCWGHWKEAAERSGTIRQLIPRLSCLGVTKQGQPKHPLYLASTTQLIPLPMLEEGQE